MGRPAVPSPRVALSVLFYEFLKVSLMASGGGVAWAHRITVDRRRWLNDAEFTDIVSVCQFMPGPNVVGIAVCVGAKLRGLLGAVAATAGFVLIPGIVGFSLGTLWFRHTGVPLLQNILIGISAAAAGMMIATGMRLLRAYRRRLPALLFAALAFAGIAIGQFPLLLVLLILAPLSIATAAIAGRVR
ncbi:MAG TPA: chromate transporter [Stellaceae bacterium]|nr:chromate transporter [Stellaceae bacterium]